MKVSKVIDRNDGGVDVMLEDITEDEMMALMAAGFAAILEEQVAHMKERRKIPAILRGDGV